MTRHVASLWSTYLFVPLLAGLLASCQDSPPTGVEPPGASYEIFEARTGGNPDFFFSSPLASNPQPGDATFDEGAANSGLVPYVRICRTSLATEACDEDVTEAVTGSSEGLAMSYNADNELYQVNWRTGALQESDTFRIEVWGLALQSAAERDQVDSRWLFGWRDIANSPSTAACDGSEAYCLINYGQTIPVKVRIEDFVFCPLSRNCAVQFVASGTDANLEATLEEDQVASSVQLFIPGQEGTDFAIAFEPCSAEENAAVDASIALPTFGPCLKTVTPPGEITLVEPATVSLCVEIDEAALESQLAVPETQHGLLTLHHFNTQGVPGGDIVEVEAWPHVPARCEAPTSGGIALGESPDGLLGRAFVLGERFLSWMGPRRLVALDIGGGGQGWELRSFFKLALPARFEYVSAGDANQVGSAGSQLTLQALVTDLNGDPVWNAKVGWELISAPAGDAGVVSVPPINTGLNGIAEATVQLSSTEGDNVFHATGLGIADDRELGCTVFGGTVGAAACNGPRSAYDPFQPLPATDPLPEDAVVILAKDTRLPFTVYGCIPGRGSASVDGTLGDGEWECARSATFPVNLSGGSTTEATLYWMNDDQDLYLAVSVPETDRQNGLRIDWDNDGDGGREVGDDVWEFDPSTGPADKFIDDRCSSSSQSGCGANDSELGGAMQTVAVFNNTQGNATVYEMSHPLSTGDTCTDADPRKGCGTALGRAIDVALGQGDSAGVFVTLRLGSGAQGNTQWPGFLDFMEITIQ